MSKTKTKEQIPNKPIAYIAYLLRQHKGVVFLTFFVVTLAQLLSNSVPFIFKQIIDTVQNGEVNEAAIQATIPWIIALPLIVAVTFALWRTSGFLGMKWMTAVNSNSYKTLFAYLGDHSHTYFSNRFAGALSSKISHASEGAQSLLESAVWNYYQGVLSLIITAVYIFYINLIAGVVFLLLLVILIPVNILLAKYRRPHVVSFATQASRTRGRLVDALTNISAVRQYARNEHEEQTFGDEVKKMRLLNIKQWNISEWGLVLNNVLIVLFELALVAIISYLWAKGRISTGDLVMGVTLLMNINETLTFIGASINSFIRKYADVEEGLEDILKEHEIVDVENAKELEVKSGRVEWKNVTFDYGNISVFKDFSLDIKPGQRVGLVGHSGAGKTTFVSLLLRQHELTKGSISIDEQSIAEVTQESLRQNIAVVPQEPLLFHRSIRDNIAYGKREATDDEIIAVAKKAEAHEFISTLSHGYDTLVGERGVKLSGGQKQRIAIARAMLKNAPILILDEATSALDSESEVAIQRALHELMVGKTVIAIAHRLSTLREMDRIIVLENGHIAEDGNHESLKSAGGIYQRLWEHQAGGFLVE